MGNKLSFDYYIDYAIYNGHLDDLQYKDVKTTYKNVMYDSFCGLHQLEAVIKLIWNKGIYEKAHVSLKYAQLVKKLENEVEGGTNKFSDVFLDFVKQTVACDLKELELRKPDQIENISINIATFLGHLVVVDVFDLQVLANIIRPAHGKKELDKAFDCLKEIIKNKLKANGSIFEALFQIENKDVKKIK